MLKFQFLNKLEYIIRRHKDIRPKYIISYNDCDASYIEQAGQFKT